MASTPCQKPSGPLVARIPRITDGTELFDLDHSDSCVRRSWASSNEVDTQRFRGREGQEDDRSCSGARYPPICMPTLTASIGVATRTAEIPAHAAAKPLIAGLRRFSGSRWNSVLSGDGSGQRPPPSMSVAGHGRQHGAQRLSSLIHERRGRRQPRARAHHCRHHHQPSSHCRYDATLWQMLHGAYAPSSTLLFRGELKWNSKSEKNC